MANLDTLAARTQMGTADRMVSWAPMYHDMGLMAVLLPTPPTALKLLARRKAAGIDLSTWRYAWIGGEAVFPKVLDDFNAAYAQAGLAQGVLQPTYGMAETVVGISCGIPVDPEDAALPNGTEGRVMVRGPSVISGYLGLPRHPEGAWFERQA